ncbi:MAG: GNAT family N-acetyltransferase [Gammaproteobacteria bacterium]|nr:GNAT family N-acetyltransferase [Gammaproteobacteria bacterium]
MQLIRKDDLSLAVLEPFDFSILRNYYLANREHLAPWEPTRTDDYFTAANIKDVINSRYEQFIARTALHLCALNEERMVAEVNFTNIVTGAFQSCNLGFSVERSSEGHGVMTKVLKLGIEYIFEEYRLHRIQANYMPSNRRSPQVLARCGFRVEGYAREYLKIAGKWEDHVLTSLINSQRIE